MNKLIQRWSTKMLLLTTVVLIGGMCLPARAALLVHYTFDEASSGTTTAINTGTLGSGFDGNFNGTTTRVNTTPAGYSLGAANLNGGGSSNFVGPASADIGPLSKITVSMWVNVQTQPGGFNVFGSDLYSSGGGHGWFLYFTPEPGNLQKLGFEVDNSATQATTTVNALNTWLFVAATWDQSSTGSELSFYAGTPSSAVTQVGTTVALTTSMSTFSLASLRVGGYSSNPGTAPDSFVDDFRVYGGEIKDATALEAIRLENVPEPASMSLLALGGLLLGYRRR